MSVNAIDTPVRRRSLPTMSIGEYGWIWVATAALFLISVIIAPGSVAVGALTTMLPFAGILAIVTVGQTLIIQQRGLDMSAVGAISLAGMLVSIWGAGGHLWLAVVGTLAVGGLIGAVNGLLVTRVNVTPIVATLATNALLIGAVRQISGGAPLSAPREMRTFSIQTFLGLPYSLWLALVIVVLVAFVTSQTAFGRRFVAVGINPRAARSAGIVAQRYQVGAYIFGGLCFSAAGIISAGYLGNASHTAGNDYLLPSIAAVVVGGTPLTGGKGSVIASAVAALFMIQLGQLVLSLGASPASQLLVQAIAIVLATAIRNVPAMLRKH